MFLDIHGVFLYTDLMNKQWYIKLRKLIHNPITRKKLIKELNKLSKTWMMIQYFSSTETTE